MSYQTTTSNRNMVHICYIYTYYVVKYVKIVLFLRKSTINTLRIQNIICIFVA